MKQLILFLLLLAGPELDAAEPALVEWFEGRINGKTAASLRGEQQLRDDGGRSIRGELALALTRILGQQKARIDTRDSHAFEYDAGGRMLSFRLDHEEAGTVTSALGTVADGRIEALMHRDGRSSTVALALPSGPRLLDDRLAQDALVAARLEPGASFAYRSVALMSGRLVLVTSTAVAKGTDPAGNLRFSVTQDALPITSEITVSPNGRMAHLLMLVGPFRFEFLPASGPVALLAQDLSLAGQVRSDPPPRGPGPHRYRLPPGMTALSDGFQSQTGAIVSVLDAAPPTALDHRERLLAAEPQLELDDPGLRSWVLDLAARARSSGGGDARVAESLRLAVRSHITRKDLTQGDASALQAFTSRTGDCTEHASLLCAALRIAGIPARIEVGLVYIPDLGGWVGHAWNAAHAGGRWIHLDSAYPGLRRSHYLSLASEEEIASKGISAGMAKLIPLMGGNLPALD